MSDRRQHIAKVFSRCLELKSGKFYDRRQRGETSPDSGCVVRRTGFMYVRITIVRCGVPYLLCQGFSRTSVQWLREGSTLSIYNYRLGVCRTIVFIMHNLSRFARRIASIAILLVCFPFFGAKAQEDSSNPPIATNSIKAISLGELNLQTGDYIVLPTITVTSLVSVAWRGKNEFTINVEDEDFMLKYRWDGGKKSWVLRDWEGVVKMGFLANDTKLFIPQHPTEVADKLGVYRLIAQAQAKGADGIVEPIISTNMAKNGNKLFFKTTVTARPVILKTAK